MDQNEQVSKEAEIKKLLRAEIIKRSPQYEKEIASAFDDNDDSLEGKEFDKLIEAFCSSAISFADQQCAERDERIKELEEACKTVVHGYEGDGMEQMHTRDHVFYRACKSALTTPSIGE